MFDPYSFPLNESVPETGGSDNIADLLGQLTQIRKAIERDSTLSCETPAFEKKENEVERDSFYHLLSKTHPENNSCLEQQTHWTEIRSCHQEPQRYSALPLPKKEKTWTSNPAIPPEVKPVSSPLTDREETGESSYYRHQQYVAPSRNHGTLITSPPISPERRSVKKKRGAFHETAASDEAIVIPLQEVRKKRSEMGKKNRISQRPQKKNHWPENEWANSSVRGVPATHVASSTWPPTLHDDKYLLNCSGILGHFLLIAGWGLVTCGFLLYLRSLFVTRGFWGEYSFPLLGAGAFLLLIGVVIEFLTHKSHLVNELQYRVATLKHPAPEKKQRASEKKCEIEIANEPKEDDDETKQLEANYRRLLELRDEIDILLQGAEVSSI